MKRIIIIFAILTLFVIYGCEDETPDFKNCKQVYGVHIKLWDSLYATGKVSDVNMQHILRQVNLEYQQCVEK